MNGPHCPKCGSPDKWQDSLDQWLCGGCGYIWNRGQGSVDVVPTVIEIPPLAVSAKRRRVRALVVTLISSMDSVKIRDGAALVALAAQIDANIEAIGEPAPGAPSETLANIQGRES